jgi:hypothetical protein
MFRERTREGRPFREAKRVRFPFSSTNIFRNKSLAGENLQGFFICVLRPIKAENNTLEPRRRDARTLTHPRPGPPLEREGEIKHLPLQGGEGEGDGAASGAEWTARSNCPEFPRRPIPALLLPLKGRGLMLLR